MKNSPGWRARLREHWEITGRFGRVAYVALGLAFCVWAGAAALLWETPAAAEPPKQGERVATVAIQTAESAVPAATMEPATEAAEPTNVPTATARPTGTETARPTVTPEPIDTATARPTATIRPSATSVPSTATRRPATATSPPTATPRPLPTATSMPSLTPVRVATIALPTATLPPLPPPTAVPTAIPQPTSPPPAGNCHPSYPTVCIPPPPPNLNCGDIPYKNFTVLQPDPHGFDGNQDGVGCEN